MVGGEGRYRSSSNAGTYFNPKERGDSLTFQGGSTKSCNSRISFDRRLPECGDKGITNAQSTPPPLAPISAQDRRTTKVNTKPVSNAALENQLQHCLSPPPMGLSGRG